MPAVPDLVGAMIAHTRALPETSALAGARVSARVQNAWSLPQYAVVWRKVPGPTATRMGNVPVAQQPLQVECYGADLRTADLLWRTLHAELFPDPPTAQGFHAAGCAVIQLEQSGAAAPLMESETDFPRVVTTYVATYCERGV